MNTSRRSFLRKSALGLGAMAFASPAMEALATNAKYSKLVGIQLYSIREDMKSDPMGTLTKLAEMGTNMSNMRIISIANFTAGRPPNSKNAWMI